jgi:hypothetical protein
MVNATLAIVIFILLTIAYFIILNILGKNSKTPITIVYYCSVVLSQLYIAYEISKKTCGTPQIGDIFIWSIIPWVIIFFSLNLLLRLFPGWKAPFSNTFGYLITRIMGIKGLFNKLIKSDFNANDKGLSKIAEYIFEDQSMLINEMTPENFDLSVKKLDKLWDKSQADFSKNMNSLRYLVTLKDYISEMIWFLLTGVLTISISSMGLLSSKCNKSVSQIKDEVEKYKEEIKAQKQNEKDKKERIYYIRE